MNLQKSASKVTFNLATTDVDGNPITPAEQSVFVYVDGVKASAALAPTLTAGNGGEVAISSYIPDAVGTYSVTITAIKTGYTLESIQTTAVEVTVIDLDNIAPNRPVDLTAVA